MDHLIGQRFSLISKSEIRYVGTLHEINPEQSTIALEEVYSFGTEDRTVDSFIPPSQQKFEYIVFRGGDVKDIKIAEDEKENKQPPIPAPPNDPAILNASRPGPQQGQPQVPPPGPPHPNRRESPYPPPGYPQQGQFPGYYAPPPNQFGRGFGPPHGGFGPGPGYSPYGPPPPGYFGPPGHGFPQNPNQFPQHQQHQQPPPPSVSTRDPGQRQPSPHHPPAPKPAPQQAPEPTQELPVEKAASRDGNNKASAGLSYASAAQIPPPENTLPTTDATTKPTKATPTQPKSNRVAPAVPFTVNQKAFVPPVTSTEPPSATQNGTAKAAPSQTSMEEASRQAKEAVAAAMAKLNPQAAGPKPALPGNTVDSLTQKVSEMSTGSGPVRGRGAFRGTRGPRTAPGGQSRKIDIPKSDFDFESANAKFNKEDLIKEAIASGSPLGETAEGGLNGESKLDEHDTLKRRESGSAPLYNKSTSFFDNISSEAKDREDSTDPRTNARAMRGQEFKKNIETFGQGNVDSGFRGRGRGFRGGGYRGGYNNRGYRGRGRGGANNATPTQT